MAEACRLAELTCEEMQQIEDAMAAEDAALVADGPMLPVEGDAMPLMLGVG